MLLLGVTAHTYSSSTGETEGAVHQGPEASLEKTGFQVTSLLGWDPHAKQTFYRISTSCLKDPLKN